MKFAALLLLVAVGVAAAAYIPQPVRRQAVVENKGLSDLINQLVINAQAQAAAVIANVQAQLAVAQGQVTALSQAAIAQAQASLAQLQAAAQLAQGQALTTIQGLIDNLENLVSGNSRSSFENKDLSSLISQVIANVVDHATVVVNNIVAHATLVGGQLTTLSQAAQAQAQATIATLQQVASLATGQVATTIQGLIQNLQNLVSGNARVAQNKGFVEIVQQVIASAVAQATAIVANIQAQAAVIGGHVVTLSQAAAVQAQAAIQELQQVAQFAHGQALASINGLIENLQSLVAGNGRIAVPLFANSGLRTSGNKDLSSLISQLVSNIQTQAAAVIANIQQQVSAVHGQVTDLSAAAVAQAQATLASLQQVASLATGQAQTTLQGLIQNLENILSGNTRVAENKGFMEIVQQLIASAVGHASTIVANVQAQAAVIGGHVTTLSQAALAQAQAALAELQQVAQFAHGQALNSINGLIENLETLVSGNAQSRIQTYQNKDFADLINQLLVNAQAHAASVIAAAQGHLTALSQAAIAQAQASLAELQAGAQVAQGQTLALIQGLIAHIQNIISGNSRVAVNKDLSGLISQVVANVVAQATTVVNNIVAHATLVGGQISTLSATAQAQVQATIASLQQVASVASGQVAITIQGLIQNLQDFLSGN